MTTEQKIKRYHSQEIMLILFICSSDLSNYDDGNLISFAEDIEGRIEVLFENEYLIGLKDHFQITTDILNDFQSLKEFLSRLYASSWHRKMKNESVWRRANAMSSELLKKLNLDLVEPNEFKETHLDVDWT